ncbi:hypothetical protein CIB48_g10855 [Xylaria polymorpha]|nr:hypothetical protein CIB48_g10855 [Xylaria polymorpha]
MGLEKQLLALIGRQCDRQLVCSASLVSGVHAMQLPSQADQGRSLDMALKNCKGHLLSLFRMSVAATHGAYSSTWRLSVSTYMLQGGAYLQYPNAPCPDRLSRIIHHNDFADSQGNRVPSKIELPYRNCVTSRSTYRLTYMYREDLPREVPSLLSTTLFTRM